MIFTAEPSRIGKIVCTTPLPKVFTPTSVPTPESWIAPAVISEAEAVYWLTSTASGRGAIAVFSASYSVSTPARDCTLTIGPLEMNFDDTSTAALR